MGQFQLIHKNDLVVDHSYQRDVVAKSRLIEYTNEFSWEAFGCLIVVKRYGIFYVVDGQHRKLSADSIKEIKFLPCLVFDSDSIKKEAETFLNINVNRSKVTIFDRYKSLIISGDPTAIGITKLVESTGHHISKQAHVLSVRCIGTLLRLYKKNSNILEEVWCMLDQMNEKNASMSHYMLDGFCFLESELRKEKKTLFTQDIQKRLLFLGHDKIYKGIRNSIAIHGISTLPVYAAGICQVFNHGRKKNKLNFDYIGKV